MGLRISTNIATIQASRHLGQNNRAIEKAFAQMASGSRINKAADDAAGLSISENIKSVIRSLGQGNRNAQDGISMVQTAEGGLNEIANIVVRLRELGVQAASDTVGDVERGFINKEVSQLKLELDRIAKVTRWGETILLDGSAPVFEIQVGINNDDFEDRIAFEPAQNQATLDQLGIDFIDFSSKKDAQNALNPLDEALVLVNSMRSNLGALETRLRHSEANQEIYLENMAAANSRIRDTDLAQATSELTSKQILFQAATATLAQANQRHAGALTLLS